MKKICLWSRKTFPCRQQYHESILMCFIKFVWWAGNFCEAFAGKTENAIKAFVLQNFFFYSCENQKLVENIKQPAMNETYTDSFHRWAYVFNFSVKPSEIINSTAAQYFTENFLVLKNIKNFVIGKTLFPLFIYESLFQSRSALRFHYETERQRILSDISFQHSPW